jgi:hypothetical protein
VKLSMHDIVKIQGERMALQEGAGLIGNQDENVPIAEILDKRRSVNAMMTTVDPDSVPLAYQRSSPRRSQRRRSNDDDDDDVPLSQLQLK